MRIAIAQTRPIWLNKAKTTQKILQLIKEASDKKADLIAFPETFLSGYPFWVCRTDATQFDEISQKKAYAYYLEAAVEASGPELQLVTGAARDFGIFVYLGVTERGSDAGSGTAYCTLVAIDPTKGVVSSHRKLMPTWDEQLVWGIGDGNGLRVHRIGEARVGGLNCWENWMPLARFAMYSGGEDIHISVWPGNASVSADITRTIALEGRVWSIAAHGLLSIEDIPSDFPVLDSLNERGVTNIFNGGSAVISPRGEYVIAPVLHEEGLITADINLNLVKQERANFDPSGHYSRPDVFEVKVNRQRLQALSFED